jgi:thiamine pyrophosphate-dependent acetolactate synthase large subunit-like protein
VRWQAGHALVDGQCSVGDLHPVHILLIIRHQKSKFVTQYNLLYQRVSTNEKSEWELLMEAADKWGSDIIAEAIVRSGFTFAAINPGASYRGLHDSFINNPSSRIDLITCLHEEHAVALAHGWTKVTDEPALAIVHSNVGTLHASMAVYNAWADRAPVFILSATGSMDAERRRPWIEWIHTVQDQAAILRPFTKWDDQPASPAAAARAIARGRFLSTLAPSGPVHVCLDVSDQEAEVPLGTDVAALVAMPATAAASLSEAQAADIADRLEKAQRPLFLFGRLSRNAEDWNDRIDLIERSGARAFTDIRSPAAFPTDHAAHVGAPGFAPDAQQRAALASCDLLILFDPIDPATVVHLAPSADTILISPDLNAQRGWVKDAQPIPNRGTIFPVSPSCVAAALKRHLPTSLNGKWSTLAEASEPAMEAHSLPGPPAFARIAAGLIRLRTGDIPLTVTRLPLSWDGALLPFWHPLDYLGRDGGEGLASGPGIAVGVALALVGSGRLPVAVLGDGDFMMGATAMWTAANRSLPLLLIIAANGVYGNDVVHQERIARDRSRDIENCWIGQTLNAPEIRIADMARSMGAVKALRIDQNDAGLPEAVEDLGRLALARNGPTLLEVSMPAI